MKKLMGFFIQGLILFIPLIITGFILLKLFDFFTGYFSFVGFTESAITNAFLGLILTLCFVVFLGVLASSFIFQSVFNYLEEKLEHVPFIRHIYSPVKDFTNAFVGNKRKFNKPVLVLTNKENNIQEIGFITKDDLSDFEIKDKVAVYLPFSYSFTGKLIIVPKEQIQNLKSDAADAMKFVLSGGLTDKD